MQGTFFSANELHWVAEGAVKAAPTGGLRLSPHIYNSMADVDRVVQAVAQEGKALSGSVP